MGCADRKPKGYWSYDNTLNELNCVITERGHFPTRFELSQLKDMGLLGAIKKHGGTNKFRELLGWTFIQRSAGYWTDVRIISELREIIDKINHFPLKNELYLIGRGDLGTAISRHGGIDKFRGLLGYDLHIKADGYWNEETIITKLKQIMIEVGHFPKYLELIKLELSCLSNAMSKHGGFNYYRQKLGHDPLQVDTGYWTEEQILKEISKIITVIGHFPTRQELEMTRKRSDLSGAITRQGGFNYFRRKLGHDLLHVEVGYWADETIINELKIIMDKNKHFPTQSELYCLGRSDIICAITKHGGFPKFRNLLGQTGFHKRYLSESKQYYSKRGKSTETLMKRILKVWYSENGISEPKYNKRLSKHNFLEFVCELGKTIGIDVINTKRLFGDSIRRKYLKKDYHKYLDELWIVVFSNVFTEKDYRKFNTESPDNVRVMPIDIFLKELDISTDEHLTSKIDAYNNCTFHTKDEFIKRHLIKNANNYVAPDENTNKFLPDLEKAIDITSGIDQINL